jgi:succinyl-CoA synthetase alpha subunit
MAVKVVIKKNTYFDSVSLMALSTKVNTLEGVKQAVVAMNTDLNREVIRNVGLMTPEIAAAGIGDLIIAVETATAERCEAVLAEAEKLLTNKGQGQDQGSVTYATLESAARNVPGANLALISVPGEFAAREARKALDNHLHVMIFSDNVSLEDELALKRQAHDQGLLVMGPDCGTSVINRQALCFANVIREGNIGIVGASGTGCQEIAARIHDFGGGITHIIGVGGRDLHEAIGGIMMIDALRLLAADPATGIIVLVSKAPAKSVEAKVLAEIKKCGKPVIVCFLGGDKTAIEAAGGIYKKTTKEAALEAVILGGKPESEINKRALNLPLIAEVKGKLKPEQKYIRALLCGGTLCEEMMLLAMETLPDVWSNIAKDPAHKLADAHKSRGHTFIDFGDDIFTRGKPHPMIDPSLRTARFVEEAKDPEVGVIILDFILGYGAHPDPIGLMLPVLKEAKANAAKAGRHLEILGYVLGTDRDPQDYAGQIQMLLDAGVTHASSCTNSGLLARGFVEKGE